jgi:LCP family protein required for cell wall assembly
MILRFRFVLVALATLLLLAAMPQAAVARPTTNVSASTVRAGNLREQPSTTARIVAGVQPGTAVTARARSGDWVSVTVTRTGARGWMIRSLLNVSNSQFAALPAQGGQAAAPATGGTAAGISASLVRDGNLREQPSTAARIVTGLAPGTAVTVAARSGDWARVTVTRTGARGWVIRTLLNLSNNQFAALPAEGGQVSAPAPSSGGAVTTVGGTTVLLVGIDRRPGEKTARADAILLMRLNPQGGVVSLLSVPRDLWVPIPGVGNGRINAGYQYGGLALQKRTVSDFLGVRIDHAVAINFGGFEALIDALGGVTINVPRRLVDPAYPTPDYGTTRVVFEPGVQRMNGARALIYSRTRHPDSDFGRMHRQQQMMAAIGAQLRALGVGGTAARAGSIAASLSNYVVTDMPVTTAGSVLWTTWNSIGSSRLYVIDQRYASFGNVGGASVLIPNRAAIRGLVNQWAS